MKNTRSSKSEYVNKKAAREHFESLGIDMAHKVMHHVDKRMKSENPERYAEWRPEDLVPMTKSEHRRLHMKDAVRKGSRKTRGHRKAISRGIREFQAKLAGTSVVILDEKTGRAESFPSFAAAARFLGCTRQHVSQAFKLRNLAGGWRITRI